MFQEDEYLLQGNLSGKHLYLNIRLRIGLKQILINKIYFTA